MNRVRYFVRVEYVGGPWDGKREIRRHPVAPDVRVPLLRPIAVVQPLEPEINPSFRYGEYVIERSGRTEEVYEPVAIATPLLGAAKLDEFEMAEVALHGHAPVIYTWIGEP